MTKPSSAFPISHSGLTFQQLPLRAGFTSSLRGAGAVQLGTAGLARQDRHGTARLPPCTLAPVAPCTVARRNQHGTAWHGYPLAAWHKPRPCLAAAPLPGVIHGMRFSHGCCRCPDLQLQHRPDLLSTWGDPPVQPIPAPPGRAPQRRGLGSPRAVSERETTC